MSLSSSLIPPPDVGGEGEVVASLIVNDLTADRLVYADSTKKLSSVANLASWVAGSNVTVTDDLDGTITVSIPQSVATSASPTFVGATFSGLTASRLVSTTAGKALASVAELSSWVTGTANRVTVASDGSGGITLTTPQPTHTGADPTFASMTLTGSLVVAGIETSLGLVFNPDNTLDIGNVATLRPRTVYAATSVIAPSMTVSGLTPTHVLFTGAGGLVSGDAGMTYDATNDALTVGLARIFTNGTNCQFWGQNSGNFTHTGVDCIGIGNDTLKSLTIGTWNIGIGEGALKSLTDAHSCIAIGTGALAFCTTGSNNTAIGYALAALVGGINNTAIGDNCLIQLVDGIGCTALGYQSLFNSTSDDNNTAIGVDALYTCNGGQYQTAVGASSLRLTSTGQNNTALGVGSGATNTTGSQNTYIGTGADASGIAYDKAIAIGYNAIVGASSTMVLGGTGADAVSVVINGTTAAKRLEVRDSAAAQLRLTYTAASVYTDIETGSGGTTTISNTGSVLQYAQSFAGSLILSVQNTNAAGGVRIRARAPAGGADPAFTANVGGSDLWTWGVDNDDSDAFVLSAGTTLGTTNQMRFLSGTLTLYGNTIYATDNTYDIGASGATRPRTGYFGTSLNVVAGAVLADTNGITFADAKNIIVNATTGTKIGTATTQKIGLWNAAPVVQQVGGVTLTNNVTAGGTTNQLDDFTSLTIYATDAAAIRNNIYQLGRKLKLVTDLLRTIGAAQNADA